MTSPSRPPGHDPSPAGPAPRRAAGVEVLGPMAGSGYRTPPVLVRRGDGQTVQLTPLLAAVLSAVDGRRDLDEVAAAVAAETGRPVGPEDVAYLLDERLRPLALVVAADGTEPVPTRRSVLLGLRGRVALCPPAVTRRLAAPVVWLFRPWAVTVVLLAFAALNVWLFGSHGLSDAVDAALADPALLLALVVATIASAAFHELGHAAAMRYAGADPGAMGAAIYLIWPVFYTDVTDSYRLPRRDRLRVDLGGLYFNAVFSLGVAATAAATGADALLVLIPVQLFQMLRQLVPLVRFDGYHILADLVGVPDLFARIRPALLRTLPWRRHQLDPNPLRPWAHAVVVTWVAVVVPALLAAFGFLLVNLPDLLVGSVESLARQAGLFGANVEQGRYVAVTLGAIAIATVAFIPLSTLYLTGRIGGRFLRGYWRATEQRPTLRALSAAAVVGVALASGPQLLPETRRQVAGTAATASERPPAADVVASPVSSLPTIDDGELLALRSELTVATSAATTDPAGTVSRRMPTSAPVVAGPGEDAVAAPQDRGAWPFPFPPPRPPSPGDNQLIVTNGLDGSDVFELQTSMTWTESTVLETANHAYALASCAQCRTVAVAFQITAAVDPVATAVPENIAVAGNVDCEACLTEAIAVQLAVTLQGSPDPQVRADLDHLLAAVASRRDEFATMTPQQVLDELATVKQTALQLLAPWLPGSGTDTSETAATAGASVAAVDSDGLDRHSSDGQILDPPTSTTHTADASVDEARAAVEGATTSDELSQIAAGSEPEAQATGEAPADGEPDLEAETAASVTTEPAPSTDGTIIEP